MKISFAAVTLAGFVALGTGGASATSILVDHGDTTYDPNTRLEWLDVNLTAGIGYNPVAAGYGLYTTVDHYRFATSDELLQLFYDAGASGPSYSDFLPLFPGSSPQDIRYDTAALLLSLLGVTQSPRTLDITLDQTFGLLAESDSAGTHRMGSFATEIVVRGATTYTSILFSGDATLSYPDNKPAMWIGAFLVREVAPPPTPTPLPASLPLLVSTLTGLGFFGWRSQRR